MILTFDMVDNQIDYMNRKDEMNQQYVLTYEIVDEYMIRINWMI